MKMTIGHPAFMGVGDPQTVELRPDQPIRIEGLDLEISVDANGILSVRGTDIYRPVVRAVSSNHVTVVPEPLSAVYGRGEGV